MKKFSQVFWFHFKDSVASKFSIITMMLVFIGIVAFFGITHFIGGGESEAIQITVIQNSENFVIDEMVLNEMSDDIEFTVLPYSALEQARLDLDNGDIENIFVVEGEITPTVQSISYMESHFQSEFILIQILQRLNILQVMEIYHISVEVAENLLAQVVVTHETVRDIDEFVGNFLIGFAFNLILFLMLVGYGAMISMVILNEKTSRVMEIMISKVKPVIMMYAKIFAILGSLLTLTMTAILGVLVSNLLGWFDFNSFELGFFDFSIITLPVILVGAMFLIVGYFLYGIIFATVGALCSKQEDLQTVQAPVMVVLMLPYMYSSFAPMTGLDNLLTRILSYIPVFSPFVTFTRFLMGYANGLEIGLVFTVMVVTIIVIGKLATKLYVGGVMHYSERFSFKDIRKLMNIN